MEPQKRTLSLIRMLLDEEMVSSFSAFRSSPVHQRRNLRLVNLRSGCNPPPRALSLKRNFEWEGGVHDREDMESTDVLVVVDAAPARAVSPVEPRRRTLLAR